MRYDQMNDAETLKTISKPLSFGTRMGKNVIQFSMTFLRAFI